MFGILSLKFQELIVMISFEGFEHKVHPHALADGIFRFNSVFVFADF